MLCVFLVCFSIPGFTQTDNGNIVIDNAREEFSYTAVKGGNGAVKVEVASHVTYICKNYATSIDVVEPYNDDVRIDHVAIFIDGELNEEIRPRFEYHETSNVFYTDLKHCYIRLPFLKKNSTAETSFKKTISSPHYLSRIPLADRFETRSKKIRLLVPTWMSIEVKEINFAGWNITRSQEQMKDGIVYTYTISNAPALKHEPNSPGPSYYMPHIVVIPKASQLNGSERTYFRALSDQYNWYRSMLDSVGNDETAVKQKALEIVAGKTADEEKVKAIFYWVQQNIRYIAFEDGIAGQRPKKAQDVLNKKYGDCKGMANLQVAMLRSLGYDARLCWLGTNHLAYDQSLTSPCVNNHMIAAWMRNGKPVFLDGTEKFIRFGETAERIQGRQILIENGTSYLIEPAPVVQHQQNTAIEQRMLHLVGHDLQGSVIHTYKGESREQMLALLDALPLDRRQEILRKHLSGSSDAYQISNLTISDLTDNNADLVVKYDVIQKGAVSTFGNESYLDMDNRKQFSVYRPDTAERHLPVCFPYKEHEVLDISIVLPANAKVGHLPKAVTLKNPDYGYNGQWLQKDGALTYHSECWLDKTLFPLSQLPVLNKDVQLIQTFYDAQPELSF